MAIGITYYRSLSNPRGLATVLYAAVEHHRVFSTAGEKVKEMPAVCTADELHYVSVPGSRWKLALWRFIPPPQVTPRNHPLFLLSGIGTIAVAYDLSPKCSFARYTCNEGFDTWIVELRGSGLSIEATEKEIDKSANEISDTTESASGFDSILTNISNGDPTSIPTICSESKLVTRLTESFIIISDKLSVFLGKNRSRILSFSLFDRIARFVEVSSSSKRFNKIRTKLLRLVEARQRSHNVSQTGVLSQKLVDLSEKSQNRTSPKFFDLYERFTSTVEKFRQQLVLTVKYDWDFDNYLEEDISAAVRWNT